MTAILIKRHQFSGLGKVYSRDPDGLSAILRGIAIDNARLKVEVSGVKQFTDNSTGTAGFSIVALTIGLPASSAASGVQAAADTIAALDKTSTTATGASAASFASTAVALKAAKDNFARLVNGANAIFAAVGASKVSAQVLGPHALDLALIAIPTVTSVAAGPSAVAKADADAFLTAYANNVATLAAKWNAAMNAGSPGAGPLHVVAG
jgi:hypothetical protein